MVPHKIVIPAVMHNNDKKGEIIDTLTKRKVCKFKSHMVDLRFGITYHKIQGKTVDKLVLSLAHTKFKPHLSFCGLFVGQTRLRLPPGGNLNHLRRLKPPPTLAKWYKGFKKLPHFQNGKKIDAL